MGKFTLIGPSNTFSNIELVKLKCRCAGYTVNISQECENILLTQENKILDLTVLPAELQEDMVKYHLGDTMEYRVYPTEPEYNIENIICEFANDHIVKVGGVLIDTLDELYVRYNAWKNMRRNLRNVRMVTKQEFNDILVKNGYLDNDLSK